MKELGIYTTLPLKMRGKSFKKIMQKVLNKKIKKIIDQDYTIRILFKNGKQFVFSRLEIIKEIEDYLINHKNIQVLRITKRKNEDDSYECRLFPNKLTGNILTVCNNFIALEKSRKK